MAIVASIYFGIGLLLAIGFLLISYFDSDDARFHAEMFISALILFFFWPVGIGALISDVVEEWWRDYKYNKEHRRKNHGSKS